MKLKLKNKTVMQEHLMFFVPHMIKKTRSTEPLLMHNDSAKKIWVCLLQELDEAGIPKKMIAENCQISLKTLRRLENGSVKSPTYTTFKKLLAFYCSVIS